MGKVAQPIRVALTGNTVSPSLDVTLELAGRLRTQSAIRAAIVYISDND
jgi:glutamyl-tRNA synthetase